MPRRIGDLRRGSLARGESAEPGPSGGLTARSHLGTRSAGGRPNRRAAWRVAAACVSGVAVVTVAACSSSSGSGSSGSAPGANVTAAKRFAQLWHLS
jgi:hypothetical protein